jgi:hypothetical protein
MALRIKAMSNESALDLRLSQQAKIFSVAIRKNL